MTELDVHDVQQVRRASGLLGEFNTAGVLWAADVHVAMRLGRLSGEADESVLLAAALTVRAVRHGSVCIDLSTAQETTVVEGGDPAVLARLAWPEPDGWLAATARSPLVGVGVDGDPDRPLRLTGRLLYLDRYWRQEQRIADVLDEAAARPAPSIDADRLRAAVARLFPAPAPDRQRLAAVVAAHRWFSILAGGPGTGKTTTVARLLALLQDQADGRLRIALAAPTGKATARLQQATALAADGLGAEDRERIGTLKAATLHRLLGFRPGARTRFKHDHVNRLPYDVVVVDEASMVSLTMMSRLVDALRPDSRLVLVGDPDQLASVEVGAVLGDLVERPAVEASPADLEELVAADLADLAPQEQHTARTAGVVRLAQVHRFAEEIQELATAIRSGEPDAVRAVLDRGYDRLEHVDADPATAAPAALRADVVTTGRRLVAASRSGDAGAALAALDAHRVLCAHREGPYGVAAWGRHVEEWVREVVDGYAVPGPWYVGRPLLVTSNDYQLRLFNGDTGVVIDVDGRPQAAFYRDGELALLATSRLTDVQTVHALSVHRSQGSQFDKVTLILPAADSPILTRELLYTAVTRAKEQVRIIGTAEALAAAVARPIVRASGLRTRR